MNPRTIGFHRAARRELRKAVGRYDEQVLALGDEFAAEVEYAVGLLAAHPEAGSPYWFGTRRVQLRRFSYSLIYTERGDEIIILAVAHHRLRPEYWLRHM